MERYFLGNNTGHGFFNGYESELKNMTRVILLKGGPGTGKSTMLKKIAMDAKSKGLDYELWYCSGDPKSLDGVYVKDIDAAVVDATSPHATNVDIPIVKDVIFDLANGIDFHKIADKRKEIEKLIKCKKAMFMRAYQHLKCALCHFNNQFEIEMQGADDRAIRAYCRSFLKRFGLMDGEGKDRKLFSHAICPSGESEYFDHLRDKKILLVEGSACLKKIFFDELKRVCRGVTLFMKPLEPSVAEGAIVNDVAIVESAGHFLSDVSEIISLAAFQNKYDTDGAREEENYVALQTAFAVDCLNKARKEHLALENIFLSAMDFSNNESKREQINKLLFG